MKAMQSPTRRSLSELLSSSLVPPPLFLIWTYVSGQADTYVRPPRRERQRQCHDASAQQAESRDERHDDGKKGGDEAQESDQEVIAALARQRIHQRRRGVPAEESARVRVIVDARHDQTEYKERHRVTHSL